MLINSLKSVVTAEERPCMEGDHNSLMLPLIWGIQADSEEGIWSGPVTRGHRALKVKVTQ
jgi:hypothetical protein